MNCDSLSLAPSDRDGSRKTIQVALLLDSAHDLRLACRVY
jgi:hypothetical protein